MSLLNFFFPSRFGATPEPSDGFWYRSIGRNTRSGIDVNADTARNLSAAFAASRVLSASGSCLPLNLQQRTGERTKEIARDHPVHRLIHHTPNDEMGSMMFRAFLIDQQVNQGNGLAEIVRDGDVAVAMWPIHYSRLVKMFRDTTTGDLYYKIRNNDHSTTDIIARDMFHVPSPVSDNGIIGKGVLECARESIGFGLAVERQGAAYFKNGMRPAVVIEQGEKKSFEDPEAMEYYRTQWMETYGGVDKTGKPVLLPRGSKLTHLSFNPEDSQFLQMRKFNIEDIARWYGVPPHMIQHLERSTFNNIEVQGIEFVVYSLIPWLKIWEEEIWRKLLTKQEQQTYYAKHNVSSLLRGDTASRQAFYTGLFNIGVLSINEIRDLEDMNEIAGGDEHYVNGTYVPISGDGANAAPEMAQEMILKQWERENNRQDESLEKLALRLEAAGADNGAAIRAALSGDIASTERIILDRFTTCTDSINANTDAQSERTRAALEMKTKLLTDHVDRRSTQLETAVRDNETARLWLLDCAERMLRNEANDARRVVKGGAKKFFAWIDDHYGDFTEKLADAITKPATAARLVATEIARGYAEYAKPGLLTVVECSEEQLERRVLDWADAFTERLTYFKGQFNE